MNQERERALDFGTYRQGDEGVGIFGHVGVDV